MNKVLLLGHVGQDPEVKHLENGSTVALVTLATNQKYTSKSGEVTEHTEWHDLEMWNGLADVVQKYVKKGHKIFIEGQLRLHKWTDSEGHSRSKVKIHVANMQMLTGIKN